MSKRLAENQLTPEELARQLNEDAQGASKEEDPIADQIEKAIIAARKIVKVKRHFSNDKVVTEEAKGGVFKLIGSLEAKETTAASAVVEAAPQFKPYNSSNSTFGGQTIPVKASEEKVSEAPLFTPA